MEETVDKVLFVAIVAVLIVVAEENRGFLSFLLFLLRGVERKVELGEGFV